MKHEVKYNGYTAQPSDYDSPDGDLALAVNLLREDGSVKPLFQPATLFHITDMEVLYFHVTPTFKHYIAKGNDNKLYWIDESSTSHTPLPLYDDTDFPPVCRINAVGNTLCVLCGSAGTPGATDGMHYFLWKSDNNSYLYLGQKPEMLDLSFGLSENKIEHYQNDNPYMHDYYIDDPYVPRVEKANYVYSYVGDGEHSWKSYVTINQSRDKLTVNQNKIDSVNDAIMASINLGNAEVAKQGHFYAPFYVRYCYRLYDGSMWMHSAPVYMPVSMPYTNTVILTNSYVENGKLRDYRSEREYNLIFYYFVRNVALTCKALCDAPFINNLKTKWGDIIKSVDIFVSLPLVREDSSEKIESFSVLGNGTQYNLENAELAIHQQERVVMLEDESTRIYHPRDCALADIPLLSEEAYMDKIRNVGAFYKVKSIDLDNFDIPTTHYGEIEINKDVLPILATQEQMDDDYKSHNLLLPLSDEDGNVVTSMFSYNSRENIAAVKEKLFNGFPMYMLTPYCTRDPSSILLGNYDVHNIYVMLSTEEGKKVVKLNYVRPDEVTHMILYNCPLFYPDSRATGMIIDVEINQSMRTLYLPMKEHAFLNGAITNGGIMSSIGTDFDTYGESVVVSDKISYPYKIYTSEVNNPFIFKATGINTIGTGTILGLSSATKALSQGQFGQFPLYAFTTEGVWALTVNDTGGFSAVHPVTRDVCTNTDSITQIDSSVLFATDRGIMMLTGSDATCVSDFLASETPFDITNMPDYALLLALPSPPPMPSMLPFSGFLEGCRMIYDYSHQRIILFNPSTSYSYAYVLSLKSKLWGMMENNISYNVNSYPDARAVTHNNDVVSFSEYESTQDAKQFLITRPLKLGDGNVYKTITTLIQRGYFVNGRIKTVLWGSNDLHRWYLIGSSVNHELRNVHGTGYKYFRFAAIGTLGDGEALSGASVEITPRYTNNLH